MAVRMLQRRGSAEAWAAINPVLARGEIGVLLNPSGDHQMRVGDGIRPWDELPFEHTGPQGEKGDTGATGATGPQGPAGSTGNAPPGAIMMTAGATAPTGWLLCDGSMVSRTTYAALFAEIGTAYGVGDGSTTFHLPNAKGKTLVGLDSAQTEFNTLGKTGGAKTHVLTEAQMPAHDHGVTSGGTHTHTLGLEYQEDADTAGAGAARRVTDIDHTTGGSGTDAVATANTTGSAHTHDVQNAGGGEAHNNLQPYLVFNVIIKT